MSHRLRATSDFTELVFLVLGHLPMVGPANLFDPRLVAWAADTLPDEDVKILGEDAPRLAAFASTSWQAWPELFADLERFAAARHRDLADLRPEDVASPGLLEELQGEGIGAELMHATLALLAPGFAALHREVIAPALAGQLERIDAAVGSLAHHVPSLGEATVEVSGTLGGHGRGFERRLVVGAPAAWHPYGSVDTALWALHEHLVRQATGGHARAEASAIRVGMDAMRSAPRELAQAHRAWLARLDLSGLSIDDR